MIEVLMWQLLESVFFTATNRWAQSQAVAEHLEMEGSTGLVWRWLNLIEHTQKSQNKVGNDSLNVKSSMLDGCNYFGYQASKSALTNSLDLLTTLTRGSPNLQ